MTTFGSYEDICHDLAVMSDDEVVKLAESFGIMPKPEPDAESMSNFRMRFLDFLL